MMKFEFLVNCYGWSGMGAEAIKFYHQLSPDLISESVNVCVLNACSHGNLVDEARSIFHSIQNKTSGIYGAMVCSIDCFTASSFLNLVN